MVPAVRGFCAGLVLLALATPGAARPLDPSADGPFAVGVTTLTLVDGTRGRTLETEVWYPARVAGRDTAARRGHYPLVLMAHGNCGSRTNYEFLTVALASWGFLVGAPDFPNVHQADCDAPVGERLNAPAADLSFLRAVFQQRGGPAEPFARLARRGRVGAVGHSLGGLAVLRASAAEPAMRAVVALAPLGAAPEGPPRRAVVVIGGSADATLPFDEFATPLFARLAPPAYLVKVLGGTHSGFTDVDRGLTPDQLARQQRLTRRYAVAFLKRYVARDRRFGRFLTGANASDVELTARPR
jgi:predicted dienelactone hydrolase